ncbi:MAG TPA: lycopene cyclase family protein [Anaerolineae bacterium]|nr:lycopene cyclase family protein [Anaerolineae bacterium]
MTRYDFIIAGGGVAGLSLARHLLRSPLRERSILIVDQDAKDRNDRTLCFWSEQPTLFDDLVHRAWRQLRFAGEDFEQVIDLGHYRYNMIRAVDFYQCIRRELSTCANAQLLQGNITRIEDGADEARVWVDGRTVAGQWVFDSRFDSSSWQPDPARYHQLRQHFTGWEIETPDAAFDTRAATFLDFRTPQNDEMRFLYVLPLSERRALVECVLTSRDDYASILKTYLETVLEISAYRIVAEEGGVNPMTDQPFPRRIGRRVMSIGARGGRVKPSSGYAFTRIQRDSAALVESLLRAGHPFAVPSDRRFFRLCDSLMLNVMYRRGAQLRPIFTALFKRNSIERIFRFLDEVTSPLENLALMASLPPGIFVQAFMRLKVLRRI